MVKELFDTTTTEKTEVAQRNQTFRAKPRVVFGQGRRFINRFCAFCAFLWLESRIDRFTFEGEHAEDAFMNAAQRLFAHEALQGLDAEGEFSQCK